MILPLQVQIVWQADHSVRMPFSEKDSTLHLQFLLWF